MLRPEGRTPVKPPAIHQHCEHHQITREDHASQGHQVQAATLLQPIRTQGRPKSYPAYHAKEGPQPKPDQGLALEVCDPS